MSSITNHSSGSIPNHGSDLIPSHDSNGEFNHGSDSIPHQDSNPHHSSNSKRIHSHNPESDSFNPPLVPMTAAQIQAGLLRGVAHCDANPGVEKLGLGTGAGAGAGAGLGRVRGRGFKRRDIGLFVLLVLSLCLLVCFGIERKVWFDTDFLGYGTGEREVYSTSASSSPSFPSLVSAGEMYENLREKDERKGMKHTTAAELLTLKQSVITRLAQHQERMGDWRFNVTGKLWDLVEEVWWVEDWVEGREEGKMEKDGQMKIEEREGEVEGGGDAKAQSMSGFRHCVHAMMHDGKWEGVLGVVREEMNVLGAGESEGNTQKMLGDQEEKHEDRVLRESRKRIKKAVEEVGRVLREMREEMIGMEEWVKGMEKLVEGLMF
ncbi:hypothetical protein ACMFMG_007835 [Clarireedia jacksonii]